MADDAVSPVIAVILMVAITVVLAATVFVLVSDIGSNTSKNAPQMGWTDDETADKWTITQAPNQVNWNAFQLKATKLTADTYQVELNGDSNAGDDVGDGTSSTVYATPAAFTGLVRGGDYLEFCSTTSGGDLNVEFVLLHIDSNAIAHRFTFTILAECA